MKDAIQIAAQMMRDDRNRNYIFRKIDDMVHGKWELPAGLSESHKAALYKVVTSDPHDAVRSIQRLLSGLIPKFKVPPLLADDINKESADVLELGLGAMFYQIDNRGATRLMNTIGWEVAKTSMCAVKVIDLEEEYAGRKALNINEALPKNAARFGRFAVPVYSSKNVHFLESPGGVTTVLLAQLKPVEIIMQEWGDRANGLKKFIKDNWKEETPKAFVYDLERFEMSDGKWVVKRYVWVAEENYESEQVALSDDISTVSMSTKGDKNKSIPAGIFPIINGEEIERDFFNWAIAYSGATTEVDSGRKFIPMLKSVVDTMQYELANMLETLNVSKAITNHYAADYIQQGSTNEVAEIISPEPGYNVIIAPPGAELQRIAVEKVNEAMLAFTERVEERMYKSTIPKIAQTGDFGANASAQGINAIYQQALGSLDPYKFVVEDLLSQIMWIIMAFISQDDEPYVIDGVGSIGQVNINPQEIFLERPVYCTLSPKEESDIQQRGAAAVAMVQSGTSQETAWEKSGLVENPAAERKKAFQEQLEATANQGFLKIENAFYDARAQGILSGAQQVVEQFLQQQAAQLEQEFEGNQEVNTPGTPQGQGANPALGNPSPVNETNVRDA